MTPIVGCRFRESRNFTMRKKHAKRKKRQHWEPPPEYFSPVNPEEFKFCAALMIAASSGQMPTPSPTKSRFLLEDQEISFTDIPFNRGVLALREHFRETRN